MLMRWIAHGWRGKIDSVAVKLPTVRQNVYHNINQTRSQSDKTRRRLCGKKTEPQCGNHGAPTECPPTCIVVVPTAPRCGSAHDATYTLVYTEMNEAKWEKSQEETLPSARDLSEYHEGRPSRFWEEPRKIMGLPWLRRGVCEGLLWERSDWAKEALI